MRQRAQFLHGDGLPIDLGNYQEHRTAFLDLMDKASANLKRLAEWEMDLLLERYGTYLSDLESLRDPELRSGEITSIVQVRDDLEALTRLPTQIRPGRHQLAKLFDLDGILKDFIPRTPWWEWVLEDFAERDAERQARGNWWWGKGDRRG